VNAANALSLLRIALAVPIVWIGIVAPAADQLYYVSLVFFVIGVATDIGDGIVARRRGTTLLGSALDPVADAVLILATLLPFALRIPTLTLAFVVLAVRDVVVFDLRLRLARAGIALPAVPASKAKTAFLDVACAALLLAMATWGYVFMALGYAALIVGVFLSLTSALRYLSRARAAHA
jgi:CDP-diacylglycerol--glycerol-3-phosphate 3-phosphatidyltransferase